MAMLQVTCLLIHLFPTKRMYSMCNVCRLEERSSYSMRKLTFLKVCSGSTSRIYTHVVLALMTNVIIDYSDYFHQRFLNLFVHKIFFLKNRCLIIICRSFNCCLEIRLVTNIYNIQMTFRLSCEDEHWIAPGLPHLNLTLQLTLTHYYCSSFNNQKNLSP